MSKTAVLYRMRTDQHLCPYGLKSRNLLRKQGFTIEDHELTSRDEIDAFKQEHHVKTTPQTFINHQRIGGYDDLKAYFGKKGADNDETSYTPIIAIFGMTALMAGALLFRGGMPGSIVGFVEIFVALSMCALAMQKLRDLSAFSLQFITYDLLAMRYVPYARAYAYLEAFAGIGMLASLPGLIVATPAIVIGVIGAASVVKAVYIDKRALKCACVGGNSNVPLGFISLTENVMMVAMGGWMLAH